MAEFFDPFEQARKELSNLDGVEIDEYEQGRFRLTVIGKEQWNRRENIVKLSSIFGDMVMSEYDPEHVRPIEEQMEFSFHNAEQLYVEADTDGVAGFFALERDPSDLTVAIIRDVITRRDARGLYFSKMLKSIYSDPSIGALIGTTINPVFVKTASLLAQRAHHDVYFGPQGIEREDVRILHEKNRRYLEREDMLAKELEPGIYLLPPQVLASITEEKFKIDIKPSDPLYSVFEHILALQKEYAGGETIAGGWAMIMNRRAEEQKKNNDSVIVRDEKDLT